MERTLVLILSIPILTASLSSEISSGSNDCPAKCSCLREYVDCSSKNLVLLPKIPKWVKQLDLSFNRLNDKAAENIREIDNLLKLKLNNNKLNSMLNFSSHSQLKQVILSKNKIRTIGTGNFGNDSSIQTLIINSNQIRIIEEASFDNLTNLLVLKLSKNEIKFLPKQLFVRQTKLQTLDLSHNNFKEIPRFLFDKLESLTTLKMSYNNIEEVMLGAFLGLKTVSTLQLDHNKIRNVSNGWIYGLESLSTLSLSNNLIKEIHPESWEPCSNLQTLDLSMNQLTAIESRTFQNLKKLNTLKLSGNFILSITQEAFSHIIQLETLLLNNNKISWTVEDMSGPFSKLHNLSNFSLASNHIKSINGKAFDGLTNLVELNLSGNNITSIQQHAFTAMPKLHKLHLNSSSFLCDCNLLWIVKWIKDKSDQRLVTATCAYPNEFRGISISKLKEDNCGDSPKPKVVEHPKTHLAIKGKSAKLVCSATSNPFRNMTFLWRKNNGNISNPSVVENTSISATGQQQATSILTIPNVTHEDSGKYQCVVSNIFGTTYSNKAKVNIVTFPKFTDTPINITVKVRETFKLSCAATGDPQPEISWKKDGGNDFPAARERRMNVMPADHLFFIINAKVSDMGVYSCAAKNSAGTLIANATVTVLEEPSFVRVMENKDVTIGDSVVLQCMISGSPKPDIKWSKDGSPIIPNERYFFTANDQLLIIVSVETSDAGTYECQITNELGTKKDMTELRILPPVAILVNEKNMTGILVITAVCSIVGTSIIWVVIIYHTRRRMSSSPVPTFPTESVKMTQIVKSDSDTPQLFPDNLSEHSSCKDSGTGDSAKQTSFDGVPFVDKSEPVRFDTVDYSTVQEVHTLLPSSFKPSVQVCVNTSVTPHTYIFSSHSVNN